MVTLHEIMTSMQRQVVIQGEDIGKSLVVSVIIGVSIISYCAGKSIMYYLSVILDGIEQNVESAAGDISEGNRQLGTAVKYKVTLCMHDDYVEIINLSS